MGSEREAIERVVAEAEHLLHAYKQDDLAHHMSELSEAERRKLAAQVLRVDFEALAQVYRSRSACSIAQDERIAPIPFLDVNMLSPDTYDQYEQRGLDLLREGKVGVIVVAGGQGSRLGHAGPKGTLDIGLSSHKSLFQLQAERLLKLSLRVGRVVPWYIMTSPENHDDTINFYASHRFFGYPEEDCFFLEQNTMPAMDHEGKLLLASPSELYLAPSGNGECFASLKRSGALEDMLRRGVTWLFYYNVDNALIQMADLVFIGMADLHSYPIASKVVSKELPEEEVGLVCMRNERPAIVEYTEFPESLLQERNVQGELTYALANVSIHMFRYDFIAQHADTSIPFHVASKAIPYLKTDGVMIASDVPNAYKLERLIFDFFPLAEGMTVLRVDREKEFAPVKNKEGEDSPRTAKQLVLRMYPEED
ncbi:UTP--glucose-1-phosphate uridylyltransferase [Paenibacillus guangzhouensis]|uniref:UTP--glucose-1-phosphate uridylyltransferase n=1 Tax=Paenibacillus guangzhouensis TaxID=1473112 RepID=UPI001266D233|nr:UDPGP type 1 family protein [Paenibacillus guangzhouensis]